MRLLLCTPICKDAKKAGGIAIWANNILEFINTNLQNDVSFEVIACDRSKRINENTSIFKRLWSGVQDYLVIVRNIKKRLKKESFDVVHVNSTASISSIKDLLIIKIAHHYNAKVVIHYHFGRIPKLVKQNNWEWMLVKKTIALADATIVMDRNSYVTLIDLGFKNVSNIPNPYSVALEKRIDSLVGTIERVKHRVLFIGRAFRLKGIYELVEACKTLDNVELRVVGPYDQEDKQNLQILCDNASWFHFIGPISHEKVLEELMACDVFVLPSYSEGFPNAILESMMCKTPIITTPVGAIPEILELDTEHPLGMSVRVQNVEDLVVAINRIIDDDAMKKEMTERAFHKVKTQYNLQTVGFQLYNTWIDLLH